MSKRKIKVYSLSTSDDDSSNAATEIADESSDYYNEDTNDGFANDGFANDGFTNDGFTNDGFTNDGFTNDEDTNDEDTHDEDTHDEDNCSDCDKKELFEAARLVVGIENFEKKISSSRWQDVQKDSIEEAAEDLCELISKSSWFLFPPSKILGQTGFTEENLICRLLKLSIKIGVCKEVLDFLKELMAYRHPRHSWPKDRKFGFFEDLMSSLGWGKFDSTSRQTIINICGSLVHSWKKEILKLLNSANGSIPISVEEDVFTCVQMFFLVEKNRLEVEQWMTTQALEPLIVNLPVSVLMYLVLELHEQEEPVIRPNNKKWSIYFIWYRDLCRIFFSEFLPCEPFYESRHLARRILNCLLCLGDAQSWKSFQLNLCKDFPQSCLLFEHFFDDDDILRAIVDSPVAIDCFERIVDSFQKSLESWVVPINRWCLPKAVVPNHPVVEAFLRSSQESMGYLNFKNIAEARIFAYYLENREDVSVSLSGSGKNSQCFIRKMNNKDYERRNVYAKQVAKCVELLLNLIVPKKREKKQKTVRPPKRSKLDTRRY